MSRSCRLASTLPVLLVLLACPPASTPDAGPGDAVQADAGGCHRPDGNGRSVPCDTDDECHCGLSCLKMDGASRGLCMQACSESAECDSAATTCGVGSLADVHRAYQLPSFSQTMCVSELAQYEPCLSALSRCTGSLECLPSVAEDRDGNGLPDFFHCQEACAWGESAASCSGGGQTCVAANAGEFELQRSDPADPASRVACQTGQCPGAACPCTGSFACTPFPEGSFCARPQGMCGSTADLMPIQEYYGGNPDRRFICDASQGIGCDLSLGGIADPAEARCVTGIFAADRSIGICLAVCGVPDDSGTYAYSGCPPTMACVTDPGFYYAIVQENGANKTCTDDASCASYAGSTCGQFGSASYCARPYGMCGYPPPVADGGVEDATSATDATQEDAGIVEDAAASQDHAVPPDGGAPEDAASED